MYVIEEMILVVLQLNWSNTLNVVEVFKINN